MLYSNINEAYDNKMEDQYNRYILFADFVKDFENRKKELDKFKK